MSGITNTLLYFIDFAGKIYISIILLRFLLQMVRADFYNPISQFIIKATHPLLKPLRRIIPSIARQDFAAIVLAYLVQCVVIIIMVLIGGGSFTLLPQILLIAFIKLIDLIFYLLYLIFIGSVILSWIAPDSRSAPATLINQTCNFLLAPLRRIIPPIGIFDITPMVALIILFFINGFIIKTIASYISLG